MAEEEGLRLTEGPLVGRGREGWQCRMHCSSEPQPKSNRLLGPVLAGGWQCRMHCSSEPLQEGGAGAKVGYARGREWQCPFFALQLRVTASAQIVISLVSAQAGVAVSQLFTSDQGHSLSEGVGGWPPTA